MNDLLDLFIEIMFPWSAEFTPKTEMVCYLGLIGSLNFYKCILTCIIM